MNDRAARLLELDAAIERVKSMAQADLRTLGEARRSLRAAESWLAEAEVYAKATGDAYLAAVMAKNEYIDSLIQSAAGKSRAGQGIETSGPNLAAHDSPDA